MTRSTRYANARIAAWIRALTGRTAVPNANPVPNPCIQAGDTWHLRVPLEEVSDAELERLTRPDPEPKRTLPTSPFPPKPSPRTKRAQAKASNGEEK